MRAHQISVLHDSGLSLGVLLDIMPGAFIALDVDWRCTHVNDRSQWLLGKNADKLLGREIGEVFPEWVGSVFERHCETAVREQRSVSFTESCEPLARWFSVRACPIPDGLAVFFDEMDVVKSAEVESDRRARETTAGASPESRSGVWQRAFESVPGHVAILDAGGRIVGVNRAWERFGTANWLADNSAPEWLGADYLGVCDAAAAAGERGAARVAAGLRGLMDGSRDGFETEYACHSAQQERWFLMRASAFNEAGERYVIVQHDSITARRKAEALVRHQVHLLSEIDAAVIGTDLEGVVTLWNDAAERLYGWRAGEALGRSAAGLWAGPADQRMVRQMLATLLEQEKWEGEMEVTDRAGRRFPCYIRHSLVSDQDGERIGAISISYDVSERHAHRRNLEASRDYLQAITTSITDGLLALNNQGTVVYGNAAAAKLLRCPEPSMAGQPVANVIGRDGDDLSAMFRGEEVMRIEQDVFFDAGGARVPVTWTSSPLRGGPQEEGHVVVFRDISAEQRDRERRDREADALHWGGRIRDAIGDNRLELFAQPIMDLRSDQITQHELLLRMHDADGTLISPDGFLPAAEKHHLMGLIDRWVINRGLQIAEQGMRVQINLSAQSIGDPDLLAELRRALERYRITAHQVTLELTETALTADVAAASAFTRGARDLGFRIALDDFGTGYNGFTNLKMIAVDELKIDIQFVQDLLDTPASENVVKAVVSLAKSFGICTVAEGVENAATLKRLRELDVDSAQGYHIGRPAPLLPAAAPPLKT